MEFRESLKTRIGLNDVQYLISEIRLGKLSIQQVYDLIWDDDERISYQAAWILTHLSQEESIWLIPKQDELMNEAMKCKQSGKRRLLLQLIWQTQKVKLRIDFLNFCLEAMSAKDEPPAVQSLCIKLAYLMTKDTPELASELKSLLEMMDVDLLAPATRATRKNILKAILSKKG